MGCGKISKRKMLLSAGELLDLCVLKVILVLSRLVTQMQWVIA